MDINHENHTTTSPIYREKESYMDEPPLAEFLRNGIIELCKVTRDIDTLDLIYKILLEFTPKEANAEK